jgi:hypothetical protein
MFNYWDYPLLFRQQDERSIRPLPSPGSGQHWAALCSKELHDEPAISYVTDRCSALTLVNSDGCGVFVTHRAEHFGL